MTTSGRNHLVSSDVRDHNLGLVLSSLDRSGPAARAEIALGTGLARSALTNLAAVLIDKRLVRNAEDAESPRRIGRPIERLELDGRHLAVVGAQVEVDEVLVMGQDLAGRSLYREVVHLRTPSGDAPAVAAIVTSVLAECVQELTKQAATPLSLDLVVPGVVPRGSGTVTYALDLGWADIAFRDLVAAGTPTFPAGIQLSGDGQLAAYAEYRAVRAEPGLAGLTDMLYVKSATGIGGGVISGGAVLRGSRGTVFTTGHVIVARDGALCECGRRGCLATVADPELVVRAAGLAELRSERGLPAALEELVRRAKAGDPDARSAVQDAVGWLKMVLDNAILMYGPQLVVLGGYLAEFADDLSDLPDSIVEFLGCGERQGRQAFLPARLGAFAALQGAISLRREALLTSPSDYGLLDTPKVRRVTQP